MVSGERSGGPGSASSSLLLRLKAQDPRAWERLVGLYGPVVYGWCRRAGLQEADAADVSQEVFRAVAGGIAHFRRDRPGDSFQGWLWVIARYKLRDHWRRRAGEAAGVGGSDALRRLEQVPEANGAGSASEVSPGEDSGLLRRALKLMQTEFEERTWQAFWQVTVEGQRPAAVAAGLGMSTGAVYVAKSRVLHRLREEFDGLIE